MACLDKNFFLSAFAVCRSERSLISRRSLCLVRVYLCREYDVRSISIQHHGVVGHGLGIHVYRLELYLATCEGMELSEARVGTESLTELVALKANGQHERVPLVFCERLVKVQHRVLIGVRAIFEIP